MCPSVPRNTQAYLETRKEAACAGFDFMIDNVTHAFMLKMFLLLHAELHLLQNYYHKKQIHVYDCFQKLRLHDSE